MGDPINAGWGIGGSGNSGGSIRWTHVINTNTAAIVWNTQPSAVPGFWETWKKSWWAFWAIWRDWYKVHGVQLPVLKWYYEWHRRGTPHALVMKALKDR